MLVSYLAAIIIFLYVVYLILGFDGFEKYHADRYMLLVCIIAILQHYTTFFINLFRVKNLLNHVTFCQSIVVILNFVCVFIFKGETLILALIAGYLVGNLMVVVLAFASGVIPKMKSVSISFPYQLTVLKKGLYLFLYSSCFYFIVISIRTVISQFYSVEEFGLFTFAFSLAQAIFFLLDALVFVIFPKVLSKLSSPLMEEVKMTIAFLREIYITSAHLLVYLALPLFPAILHFFPKYDGALTALNLIALAIIINLNSYGYADLLIARNKEKLLMKLSFSALVLNCISSLVLVKLFHVGFSYVIVATLITYFAYSFSVMYYGERLLNREYWRGYLSFYFPLRLALPFFCALILSITQLVGAYMIIPIILFLSLNVKTLMHIKDSAIKLLFKPEIINL